MAAAAIKAYASPGCVLLAFDWPDGGDHQDFLGFAIKRNPGCRRTDEAQCLFNKLDFEPLSEDARLRGGRHFPFHSSSLGSPGVGTQHGCLSLGAEGGEHGC